MNPALLLPLLEKAGGLIDNLFTSDDERNQARVQLEQLSNSLAQGQLEINKQEAKHKSLFVAGWRPGMGWLCVLAFGYHFIGHPVLLWVFAVWLPGITPPPNIDVGPLMAVVATMLGLGGYRTYEYAKGIIKK